MCAVTKRIKKTAAHDKAAARGKEVFYTAYTRYLQTHYTTKHEELQEVNYGQQQKHFPL